MHRALKRTSRNGQYQLSLTDMLFQADAGLPMIPGLIPRFSRRIGIKKHRQQIVMAMSCTLRKDAGLFFSSTMTVPQRPKGGEPLGQWTQRREAKD
jgi:hypothetical protein